jgi:hypothetical protein
MRLLAPLLLKRLDEQRPQDVPELASITVLEPPRLSQALTGA